MNFNYYDSQPDVGESELVMFRPPEEQQQIFATSVYLSSDGYASDYIQTNMPYKPHGNSCTSGIYDEDKDGVEDNKYVTWEERDKFQDGGYFATADDLFNTRHGDMPGQSSLEFDQTMLEPVDHYSLVDVDGEWRAQGKVKEAKVECIDGKLVKRMV